MKSVPKRGSVGSCRRVKAGTRMTVGTAAVTRRYRVSVLTSLPLYRPLTH